MLSAYDAVSHRHWRNWLTETLSEFSWTVLPLPDRHFFWRIRSNALTYTVSHADQLNSKYDLIIATSMVDICTLRGFRPELASVPTIIYFHENQFSYPVNPAQSTQSNVINARLNTIFTALCADKLVFNSQYNYETFFAGAKEMLHKMPDGVKPGLIDSCREKALVIPVPIISAKVVDDEAVSQSLNSRGTGLRPFELVWNHRWEYDKQPEVFFEVMKRLADEGLEFKLHVVGQSFRKIPACFASARQYLSKHIVTWGHQPTELYHHILDKSDIVVSTALHDFQGLSMQEAIHRGCVPAAPDRVAYPEYIPAGMLYNTDNEVDALHGLLRGWFNSGLPPVPSISRYLDHQLAPDYQSLVLNTIS